MDFKAIAGINEGVHGFVTEILATVVIRTKLDHHAWQRDNLTTNQKSVQIQRYNNETPKITIIKINICPEMLHPRAYYKYCI